MRESHAGGDQRRKIARDTDERGEGQRPRPTGRAGRWALALPLARTNKLVGSQKEVCCERVFARTRWNPCVVEVGFVRSRPAPLEMVSDNFGLDWAKFRLGSTNLG